MKIPFILLKNQMEEEKKFKKNSKLFDQLENPKMPLKPQKKNLKNKTK